MIVPQSIDAYNVGVEYLRVMQSLVPDPAMVDVMENLRDRVVICTWIGKNIERVNQTLRRCLLACHECFYPQDRRPTQIFAVPLAQSFGLDGLCNIFTTPTAILVDAGRVAPNDWLGIVSHEYAHAHLNSPGHRQDFAIVLSHLCLGLGLEPPLEQREALLQRWPPYNPTLDRLAFWRGETGCEHFEL